MLRAVQVLPYGSLCARRQAVPQRSTRSRCDDAHTITAPRCRPVFACPFGQGERSLLTPECLTNQVLG